MKHTRPPASLDREVRPLIEIGFGPEVYKRAKSARWRGLTPEQKRTIQPALTRGERNVWWIEHHCRIPDGVDVGKAVRLREWQARIVIAIYDNPHTTRRAIISFGKKNAKTSLTAFLVLLHVAGPEAQRNGQIPSTALSRDQAATLFKLAAACVRQSPTLNEFVGIRETIKELHCDELGTTYKALSADAKTKHGMSPIFAVHDELGQVKGPSSALYDGIENAMGAHAQPLSIIISTQAPSDADLLSQLIDDAAKGDDPQTICIVYACPEYQIDKRGERVLDRNGKPIPIDPFAESSLLMANPAAGDFLNLNELHRQARDARRMPSKEARFRNFTLNQRIDTRNPFVTRTAWNKCGFGALPTIDDLVGLDVYAGLDLSQVKDLTAFVLIGWTGTQWLTVPICWLPEHEIEEKSRTDKTEWDVWAREGYLNLTPGLTVDYAWVAKRIYDICQTIDVSRIGFDRWKMDHLKRELLRVGFDEDQVEGEDALFVPFGQGFKDMAPALDVLEGDILNQRIEHGGHPVLTRCVQNAIVKQDEAGNRKLNKPDSHGRIDALVALAMARGVAGTYEPDEEADVAAMVG